MQRSTEFDRQDVYKGKIEPLTKEIKERCAALRIPFFISFAVACGIDGAVTHKRDALTSAALKMETAGCMVYPLISVAAGSRAVPSGDAPEITYG